MQEEIEKRVIALITSGKLTEPQCLSFRQRDIPKEKPQRDNLEHTIISGGVLPDADS